MRLGLKILMVAVLTVIILVPLTMIRGTIHERQQYRRINDIWYHVTLEPLPPERAAVWDAVHRKRGNELLREEIVTCAGRSFYCAAKRQLNSKEVRRLIKMS